MDAKIIALKCPSCGNAGSIQGKDARFGFHFVCGYCGTESMLVVNQQLYVPKPHERECLKCGRVAPPNARFCQCRSPLVKACSFCLAEIPVNDEVCHQCGRQQTGIAEQDFLDFIDSVIEEETDGE